MIEPELQGWQWDPQEHTQGFRLQALHFLSSASAASVSLRNSFQRLLGVPLPSAQEFERNYRISHAGQEPSYNTPGRWAFYFPEGK